MKHLAAILLTTAELAWPFVYPRLSAPTDTVSQICACEAGGDCRCDPCPCRDHAELLRQPEGEP